MHRPTLILMMRWPAPGRCKTRLAREIGLVKAACIQKKINEHTIAVALNLEERGLIDIQLAISGIATTKAKKWGVTQGVSNIVQQGQGSLGLLMRKQILIAQKQSTNNFGHPTILIGSDLPNLCHSELINAIEALKDHEIVLGPSIDGGYWLIGLAKRLVKPVVNWPFIDMPWGTNKVLEKTIGRAKLNNVSHFLLSEKNDVDQLEDLSPWQG